MSGLPDANKRFLEGAQSRGLDIEIVRMAESTRTAEEAAQACGCDVAQIVKSLVFRGADTDTPFLFLVSGTNRVNETRAAEATGEALARPDADFVREVTGYAIGGIPPLAHKSELETFIDQDLLAFETVWAAAGTPNSVFEVAPANLRDAAGARVIAVA